MNWLARLFSPRKSEAPPTPRPARAPAAAPASPAAAGDAAEAQSFLPWLLGCAPLVPEPLRADERRALAGIDKTLALPALPDELLPRAAALIPQLLAMLRQTDLPVPALAQRIAKDVVLTAEVLRLASSPYYRAQGAVTDLQQAIALIGVEGLQTVIARVVLKPIFEAAPGPLSARAGTRLWDHAEALAAQTAEQAASAGAAPFDGYLAGLLHGSGWTIALRVLDRSGLALALPPTAEFAQAAEARAHRLFGAAAQRWSITPAFSAFAADARSQPLAGSRNALAVALRQAELPTLALLTSAAPR